MKPVKTAAFVALLYAAHSQAYFIDVDDSTLNGSEVIDFSGIDVISFDADFDVNAPMILSVQRDEDDIENPVGFSANVNNFTGFSWSAFSVRVFDGAALGQAGDVFAFTALENVPVALDGDVALTSFSIGEAAGFELGNVFGDPGIQPWLVDVSDVSTDGAFGIELSPTVISSSVPEPTTAWLVGSALIGYGAMRRRR